MKIAVLSKHHDNYSTRRMLEAARERGHEAEPIDFSECYLSITHRDPRVMYRGKHLDDFDAVIPRVGASAGFYGTAVLRQFEMAGVYCLNGSQAVSRARDKLRSMQILAKRGVAMPVTGCANQTADTDGIIKMVGGAPLIVKLVEGTQGVGVVLAETQKAAESLIDAFRGLNANILVQEFIAESRGTDLRCFVVGEKVVASMQRTAPAGEFRANIHRGGSAEKIKITPEERTTAIKAAKAMGLRVAGVDIIRSRHGSLVLEVNASPGLEGIETSTGKDVAGAIVNYVEKAMESRTGRERVDH
ncbi:MAG: 30S ribosomal protein S6--L-glutamate ligase [Myxococcales bacterium]|nr:30S ribosomal protein S6--L-glutamate ligase [Myxococcales bacterium]MCB9750029.1 30S ribosomal protein S6--L-glutamate ligase [Myxococcales bacterium]